MKKSLLFLLLVFILFPRLFAQSSEHTGIYFAKEYSKDEALYKAKDFVMDQILGISTGLVRFKIDPLASAASGELTSLVYSCDEKNATGLVLGFFGNYFNDSGVVYQGYGFKNLN
jgi:hypothetical protein